MYSYQEKIDELRSVERRSSNEYTYQVILVGVCVALAWLLLGHWQLVVWFILVYGLSAIERYLHTRSPQPYSRRLYIFYIVLGTSIACSASLLPIYLWTFDDRIYHFAAMIYSVGAVLNTFVLRAQAWPSLLCYAIPNGLAMFVVAFMFLLQEGLSASTFIGLVLAGVITIYLVILVRESVRRVAIVRGTTKELLQAQKSETVANFAGGVAHDFNNLLGVILASLEQASSEKDKQERQGLINQAIAAVERGAGLTKQLLTVGRQTEFEVKTIDMEDFTQELRQFLIRIIPSSVNLQVTCDPELTSIESEPALLQSMLLNLAMNARDAMADVGNLRVDIERVEITESQTVSAGQVKEGIYAVFRVEDDGKGIDSDIFGRVLEPFFTTRPVGEGTGLGLAMVSGFSHQVGGALDISSKESSGTIVRFFLPLQEEFSTRHQKPIEKQTASELNLGGGLKVLLVEDEPSLNTMLTRYLAAKGYSVLSCENGDQAFEAVKGGYEARVIITDLVMPGNRQGTDLISDIMPYLPGATVIMMSGYSFNQKIPAAILSGTSNSFVLQKPFKLSELDRLLDEATLELA